MRIAIAALVAAIIVFVWGFIAWAAVGLWSGQLRQLPNHLTMVEAIRASVPESGAYYFPPMSTVPEPASPEAAAREQERFLAEHRAGPVGVLLVRREGVEPMEPRVLLTGFALSFGGGVLMAAVATFLARRGARWRERFAATFAMALFAAIAVRGSDWAWFYFPSDYTIALVLDLLVGWTLAAMAVSAIVADTATVARLRR